jgi:hypothetical protein
LHYIVTNNKGFVAWTQIRVCAKTSVGEAVLRAIPDVDETDAVEHGLLNPTGSALDEPLP